jgi:hypothetical protein
VTFGFRTLVRISGAIGWSMGQVRTSARSRDVVRVNHSRAKVTGAPNHDPDLAEQHQLSQLYWYYGYRSPLWDARCSLPGYPLL